MTARTLDFRETELAVLVDESHHWKRAFITLLPEVSQVMISGHVDPHVYNGMLLDSITIKKCVDFCRYCLSNITIVYGKSVYFHLCLRY